jgi:para-aminobenzoate synthetase component 2
VILVIDNYDSFVFNIARYIEMLGEDPLVLRNDKVAIEDIAALRPRAIVISPGPSSPSEAGISLSVLHSFSGRVPILGVCLGHQCIGAAFGGRVARAKEPLHGRALPLMHEGRGLFEGLSSPLEVGCYHSLIVEAEPGMERLLRVDAHSQAGEIMALSHLRHPTYGIQFHPESVLTPSGLTIFRNFLNIARTCGISWGAHVLA